MIPIRCIIRISVRSVFAWILLVHLFTSCGGGRQADTMAVPTVTEGLYDFGNAATLGLGFPRGLLVREVFTADDGSEHYCNGAVPYIHGGTLYLMWQASREDEDSPDTRIMYASSPDYGESWSQVRTCPLPGSGEDGDCCFYTPGGWASCGDTLVAFVNRWKVEDPEGGGEALFIESPDGETWSSPRPVLMWDGSPVGGVMEQDIHALPVESGGRDSLYVTGVHFSPGLHLCPVYTTDPSGRTLWRRGEFPSEDNGEQSRELEPSFYYREAGRGGVQWVMLARDQRSSFRKLYSVSSDGGGTWTAASASGLPDSRSKQSCGNLPDGTVYTIGNPALSKDRTVLALTLSGDGVLFERAYLLEGGADMLAAPMYRGKAKTVGYSYPKACVGGGYLLWGYSVNKERIRVGRVPIAAL